MHPLHEHQPEPHPPAVLRHHRPAPRRRWRWPCSPAESRAGREASAERVHPPLPGFPHFPPKAKAVIYLHMNGGPTPARHCGTTSRSSTSYFDKDLPDSVRKGQRITTMTSGQAGFPVAPSMFKFAQHGKCGTWVSELLPHTAEVRRRHRPRQDRPHQRHQPRPGLHVRDDRQRGARQAEHRLVAQPTASAARATTCRRSSCFTPVLDVRRNGPGALHAHVGERLLPEQVQRRRPAQRRRPGALRAEPAPASARPDRRAMLDTLGELNQRTFEQLRRPGDADAHRAVRDGVPHADERAGPDRPVEGAAEDARPVRPGGDEARLVRRQRPAGPPAGRARRARRADPPPRLGPARQPARATSASQCLRHRPADRGAAHRPEAARACSTSTLVVWGGEFGRTVYSPGHADEDELRPRPPPAELLHVAGRRRHQGRARSTARPTTSATTSPRTRPT